MRLGYISVPEPKRIDNDSLMANHLSAKILKNQSGNIEIAGVFV